MNLKSTPANLNQVKSALFGIAIGDALGVPVEFNGRMLLKHDPVVDFRDYGTYVVPAGTWSDDSSLSFCLAESLTLGFDLQNIASNFVKWANENYWTAHGEVFDIGITTKNAIHRLYLGEKPELAGEQDENSNGNGSLMRILPLVFHLNDKTIEERFLMTEQVSAITHRHIRSVIACFYYLEFALLILSGKDKYQAYNELKTSIPEFLKKKNIDPSEIEKFNRILSSNINEYEIDDIASSGYVIHTLEASMYCILTTNSFSEAVLKAVNLGHDTDTTGAVTGGLAGLIQRMDTIPSHWVKEIARSRDIADLAERLAEKINQ